MKKNNDKDMWQSVTGSLNENEKPIDAAKREVFEETGLTSDKIFDCNKQYIFEIYEMWRHKYEDGVTHNTEHVFLLELEKKVDIKKEPCRNRVLKFEYKLNLFTAASHFSTRYITVFVDEI